MSTTPHTGSPGPPRRRKLLLVCATSLEMRAAVKLLPGAGALNLDSLAPVAELRLGGPCGKGAAAALPSLSLPGFELHLLICGIGPVAAALSASAALSALPALDGVINTGLAGSYDCDAAPVGSLALATEERWPDYGVWPENGEDIAGAPGSPLALRHPQGTVNGFAVFDALSLDPERMLGNMELNCHSAFGGIRISRGISVTSASVSGTPARARRLRALTGGLTENMEGFALALASKAAELPFLELRAVSNAAGLRPPASWDIPAACAAISAGLAGLLTLNPVPDPARNNNGAVRHES